MKKLLLFIFLFLFAVTQAEAQRWVDRLGKTVENAAKRTVERKAEEKTEQAVGKAMDKATDKETYKGSENSWHHLSISFNQRAFKAYINGNRVINIPNAAAPKTLGIYASNWGGMRPGMIAITNIRMAKGAVPLYDRMMSDGKFITYGITFDVGKATIKPESYGELNRIVMLMKEKSDLRFSVEGHTDSTGGADLNQKLSDERSKAVMDKLVEMGIARDRLQAVGKGQNSPVADNSTDEGRAKNRRVEFVKQ